MLGSLLVQSNRLSGTIPLGLGSLDLVMFTKFIASDNQLVLGDFQPGFLQVLDLSSCTLAFSLC